MGPHQTIEQEEGAAEDDGRHGKDHHERHHQHRPHEQRNTIQRHARRAHLEDGRDDLDGDRQRRDFGKGDQLRPEVRAFAWRVVGTR